MKYDQMQNRNLKRALEQYNWLASECEAELYFGEDGELFKLFYKRIPLTDILYVYKKHQNLHNVEGVCRMRGYGIDDESGRAPASWLERVPILMPSQP